MDVSPQVRRILLAGVSSSARLLVRHVLQSLGFAVDEVADLQAAARAGLPVPLYALVVAGGRALAEARRLAAPVHGGSAIPLVVIGQTDDADGRDDEGIAARCTEPLEPVEFLATVRLITGPERIGARRQGLHLVAGEPDPVDLHRLDDFAGGDAELIAELAVLYFTTAQSYLTQMLDALEQDADASGPAHALKGASANFGARDVAGLALVAETQGVTLQRVEGIRQALQRAERFMRSRRAPTKIRA